MSATVYSQLGPVWPITEFACPSGVQCAVMHNAEPVATILTASGADSMDLDPVSHMHFHLGGYPAISPFDTLRTYVART